MEPARTDERVRLIGTVLDAAIRRYRRRWPDPALLRTAVELHHELQGLSDPDLERPTGRPARPFRVVAWELIDELRSVTPR